MKYISMFSGVEAASLAWGPLGWEPVAFCEIEPFPCAVLKERFPDVPNLGDVSQVDWSPYAGTVDVVVGGSPCQSFSVAAGIHRTGLAGKSGLMWEFCRAVADVGPRWFLWENVPGALSSSGGEDLRCLLEFMDEHGYGLCGRILDSQFVRVPVRDDSGRITGWVGPVAQRRRRFFLVGRAGAADGAGKACAVLLDPDCLRWNNPPSREKRQELADSARAGSILGGGVAHADGADHRDVQSRSAESNSPRAYTFVDRCGGGQGGKGVLMQEEVASTLATAFPQTLVQEDGPHEGCLTPWDTQTNRVYGADGAWPTLSAGETAGMSRQAVMVPTGFSYKASAGAGSIGAEEDVSPTLLAGRNDAAVCYALAGNTIDRQPENGGNGKGYEDDGACYTLTAVDRHAVAFQQNQRDEVRLVQDDGDVAGAIAANPGMHNQNFIAHTLAFNTTAITSPANGNNPQWDDPCHTLAAQDHPPAVVCMSNSNANDVTDDDVFPTIRAAMDKDAGVVCVPEDQSEWQSSNGQNCVNALCASDAKGVGNQYVADGKCVSNGYIVRRLTPLECERLQGFPDNWTKVPYNGKTADECPDSPRYKACGNSMAVPVMRWIGERLQLVDELFD